MGWGWGEKGFASVILAFSQMCLRVHSAVFLVKGMRQLDGYSFSGWPGRDVWNCFPFLRFTGFNFFKKSPRVLVGTKVSVVRIL